MKSITRREFTKTIGAISTAAALSQFRVLGANERVRLGFIGLGNRGDQVLDAFLKQPDTEVVAVCDIYQPYVDFAAKKIGTNPKPFKDYRRLLEMKDLDAVVINTPDHWHALQTIHACEAGKDVYVEKPLSLCVAEGRAMVEAVKRHKRVCQVGTQRRSSEMYREMAEFIRGGGIGKVTVARCFHIQNEWPKGIGNPPDSEPPAELDWEAWVGPAPKQRYNQSRSLYRFRWFYDFSGGQVTNMGVHYLDCIQWALGHDAPTAVTALGGRVADIDDNREIPDTLEVTWEYPGGTLVTFSQFNATAAPASSVRRCELEFRGTKGTLFGTTTGFEVVPDAITPNAFPVRMPTDRKLERGWRVGEKPMIEPKQVTGSGDTTAPHARNFLDCVKSRELCNADAETGHRSTTTTLLANIALKTRSLLEWDATTEKVTNHPAANKLLRYNYRAPYRFPA
jgi:predicted dehydrogenase